MSGELARSRGAIELRHLRYFVTLADEESFSRAAERLAIAQPGLSQQIQSLEALLGIGLLDRSRRGFHMTLPGRIFLEEARKTLSQAEATLAATRRASRGETGTIHIGYVASAAYSGVLTQALSSFRSAYPDVSLRLSETEMRQQLKDVAGHRLDFGYIRPPAALPDGIVLLTVLREPLVVALPQGHAMAERESFPLIGLRSETFIVPPQPAEVGFHHNAVAACREAGFTPNVEASGRDFTTIASMVAVGLGVALVARSMECLRLPGVVYRSISGTSVTSDLAVVHRRGEAAPAVRAFIEHQQRKGASRPPAAFSVP